MVNVVVPTLACGSRLAAVNGRFARLTGGSSDHRQRLRALVRPYRLRVAMLSLASLVGGVAEATFLVIITRVGLAIANDKDRAGLLAAWYVSIPVAVALAAVVLVVRFVVALVGVRSSTDLSVSVASGLRADLADAYLRASWAVQQTEPSGRLPQLLTSYVNSASAVVNSMTSMVAASLSLGAMLIVSLIIDPVASLVVIVALVGLGSVLAPIRIRIKARARASTRAGMQFATAVTELGALGLEMQTYGVRDKFFERLDHLSATEMTARRRADLMRGLLTPTYTTLAYGAMVFGLGVAASVGVRELSSVGAVMLVMMRSLTYGQQLQTSSASLLGLMPSIEQIDEALHQYRRAPATSGSVPVQQVGAIEARDVGFAYSVDRPVLTGLSFRLEPGEVVGVIGPSGAGKSTLVQLLLGVREPTTGDITVGGVALSDLDRASWTDKVAFVAQDALMFSGTAAENIRFFRSDISDEQVRVASNQAQVLGDLDAMEAGLDTPLGEGGARLSGGQRQRVSIARAFAGDPHLLVLDEPTAALDPFTEALIRDTLAGLKGRATVVVIAHRMSTLEMCDRIMVIDGGHLVAFDRPDVLRQRSEFYRRALELSGIA